MQPPADTVSAGLVYLLTERLLQRVADTSTKLTELVPVAIAHVHPMFTETIRIGHPAAAALVAAIADKTARVRDKLPGRSTLFEHLEDSAAVVSRTDSVLKVGQIEMDTAHAAVYESYSAVACMLDRVLAVAVQNTAGTPEQFFEHLTATLTGPAFTAKVDELRAHFTCLDEFLVA